MIHVIRASCRTAPPALAVALILLNCTYLTAEDGFVSLFDGKSLQGWHVSAKTGHSRASKHQTGGKWVVQEGAMVGSQDIPGNGGEFQLGNTQVILVVNHVTT